MEEIRYKIYSEPMSTWCEFIPLKKNSENGEDIINLNYEELPDRVYGKQFIGNNNSNNVYMQRVVSKELLFRVEN